jgi:hypothetical protein
MIFLRLLSFTFMVKSDGLPFVKWRTSLLVYASSLSHSMVAELLPSEGKFFLQTSPICLGPPQPSEMLKYSVCLGVVMVGALKSAFTD